MSKRCPTLSGEQGKLVYRELGEINSSIEANKMVDKQVYKSLLAISKKRSAPIEYLIGSILPAAAQMMGDAHIFPLGLNVGSSVFHEFDFNMRKLGLFRAGCYLDNQHGPERIRKGIVSWFLSFMLFQHITFRVRCSPTSCQQFMMLRTIITTN